MNLRNLMKQSNVQALTEGGGTVRRVTPESHRRWTQRCRDKETKGKTITLPKPPWKKGLDDE